MVIAVAVAVVIKPLNISFLKTHPYSYGCFIGAVRPWRKQVFEGYRMERFVRSKDLTQLSQGEGYEIITIHTVQKYEFHRYAKYPTF